MMRDELLAQISVFSSARTGPLGETLPAIDQPVRDLAYKVMEVAQDAVSVPPLLYQVPEGRLKIEWSNSVKYLNIVCRSEGEIFYERVDLRDGRHEVYAKGRFPGTDLDRLRRHFDWLNWVEGNQR